MLKFFKSILSYLTPSFSDIDHYNTLYINSFPQLNNGSRLHQLPTYIMPPYDEYLSYVSCVPDNSQILELGSGSGLLSGPLVSLNSRVTLSDLSPSSLDLLRVKYQG